MITTLPAGRRALSARGTPVNYNPFWTWKPTLEHIKYLFEETLFCDVALEHDVHRAGVDGSSRWSAACLAGYALSRLNFPFAGSLGTGIFITYLVPQTLLFIPLAEIIRNYKLGDTPWSLILTYPTFLIPFCTWLMMGYFKAMPKELEECARIDGASRWQAMLYIIIPVAIPGILSAGIFAFTLSWNEFIYALVFLSSPGAEDGAGRRRLGADPRRRVLLGTADGGRAAGLDPGRDRLLVLRRALRVGPHRLGQGLEIASPRTAQERWRGFRRGAYGAGRPQGHQQVL